MFIASIPTRLKWSALQTLRRPLVDYWADSQWTVNPEIMFGYILYVCARVGVCLHVCTWEIIFRTMSPNWISYIRLS